MPQNSAVWLPAKRAPFKLDTAPYPSPGENEIVVHNHAVAINPIDWILQRVGDIIFPWLTYPTILGSDVAGEVVEVGGGVSRFKVGDRVLGHAVGSAKGRNGVSEGGFQSYTVLLQNMAAQIPQTLSFESAAVLPLGLSTAAAGLFQKDFLALNPPSAQPTPAHKTLLIWGGSTSVGINAIQLAVAAGYNVIATASPRNFDYLRRLGASEVFDYRSPTVVSDIVAALRGRVIVGALAIGAGSASACLKIVTACDGERFVAMATPPGSFENVPAGAGRLVRLLPVLVKIVSGNIGMALRARSGRAKVKFLNGSSIMANDVGGMIYEHYLPQALADGRYRALPEPSITGEGLKDIPAAVELHRQGVSALKLVVTL